MGCYLIVGGTSEVGTDLTDGSQINNSNTAPLIVFNSSKKMHLSAASYNQMSDGSANTTLSYWYKLNLE